MTNWKVKTTQEFEGELLEILLYIQDTLFMPETTLKQFLRIEEAVLGLAVMPERNPLHKAEPWRSQGIRNAVVDNYVILYQVIAERGEVVALHVFYGGRDIDELL